MKNFSLMPLYNLNSRLDKRELEWQIQEMSDKGVYGFFIVPWMELEQRYLSKEYFDMIKVILKKAQSLKMKVGIWDEYGWPTGQIAGHFQVRHPEYKMRHLRYDTIDVIGKGSLNRKINAEDFLAVFEKNSAGVISKLNYGITGDTFSCKLSSNAVKAYLFYSQVTDIILDGSLGTPWATGKPGLLNMLDKKAVDTFLKESYALYKKYIGKYFGNTLFAFFTDEPCCHMNIIVYKSSDKDGYGNLPTSRDATSFPWTPGFEKIFERTYGYSLIDNIIELIHRTDSGIKLRHDYWKLVSYLYAENYHHNIKKWCSKNGLLYTGHLFDEVPIAKQIKSQANIFDALKYFDIPGFDHLHCEIFPRCSLPLRDGNPITTKLVASLAKQLDKQRVLDEIYGAAPWSIKLSGMKKAANWDAFLGTNTFTPLFSYSIGTITNIVLPNTFYQMPVWKYYRIFAEYMERLSKFIASSHESTSMGILYPWSSLVDSVDMGNEQSREFIAVEQSLMSTVDTLLKSKINFDFIFEEIIKDAKIGKGFLRYGNCKYDTILIPSASVIPIKVWENLNKFAKSGGRLIFLGRRPSNLTDGRPIRDIYYNNDKVRFVKHVEEISDIISIGELSFNANPQDIMVIKRQLKKKNYFLIMNVAKKPVRIEIKHKKPFEIVDFVINKTYHPKVKIKLDMYLTLLDFAPEELKIMRETKKTIQENVPYDFTPCHFIEKPIDGYQFRTEGYNYLPLREWRINNNLQKFNRIPKIFYPAKKHRISANFMVIEFPKSMFVYIEKNLFSNYSINGIQLTQSYKKPNLKSFDIIHNVFDISNLVKKGENMFEADYRIPRYILDISKSQAYFHKKVTSLIRQVVLVGNFSLTETDEIIPPVKTISLGDWTQKGYKYFSGAGIYSGKFLYNQKDNCKKIFIELECFDDCAEIFIDDKRVGLFFCEPYKCEITSFLNQGVNKIEIHITNTISNLISERIPSGLKSVRFLIYK